MPPRCKIADGEQDAQKTKLRGWRMSEFNQKLESISLAINLHKECFKEFIFARVNYFAFRLFPSELKSHF